MTSRPVKVLHTIDGLGGGGSERWVWDLVRLADAERVRHRVFPIHPDLGRFVYADRLRAAGALGRARRGSAASTTRRVAGGSPGRSRLMRLAAFGNPASRQFLRTVWHAAIVFPSAAVR